MREIVVKKNFTFKVPGHYAPNYPMGHVRRERGTGYSTLPVQQTGHHTLPPQNSSGSPQIGMVHPVPQLNQQQSTLSVQAQSTSPVVNVGDNMPRTFIRVFYFYIHIER